MPLALRPKTAATGVLALDIEGAHTRSSDHRDELLSSEWCGCFYCLAIVPPADIQRFIDEDDDGVGVTAMCPRCGIDSIIGSASGFPIDNAFLLSMQKHWFR